jgi:hypothetical protein
MLGARSVIEGGAGLIGALGGDALVHAGNWLGEKGPTTKSLITGEQERRWAREVPWAQKGTMLADTLGLPSPEGSLEQVEADIGRALTGVGLTMGGGGLAQGGGQIASRIGQFLTAQPVMQGVSAASGAGAAGITREAGGSEGQQIAAGLIGGLSPAVGGVAQSRMARRFTPQARDAMGEAERLGVDLKAAPGEQVRQLSESARRLTPDTRGDAMLDIQQGVRGARDAARREVDQAYDAARATSARVPMNEVQGFAANASRNLSESGFDVEAMPALSRRLGELEQLTAIPNARDAQLRALESWRKRVNAMTPKDGSPEMAAATELKRQYDDFVTDMFNRDMIGGDSAALSAWRDARGTSAKFHSTFNANAVIRNLAKQEDMTPETMRAWLFNASGAGAKSQAGAVVKRLNDILGPDSPQMNALRAEVVADLSEPLLQRTPNIRGFLDRFDTYFRKNPTLVKTLFPEGAGDLNELQLFAKGIEKRPGARISPDAAPEQRTLWGPLGRVLTAKVFGHGIAEGGARMAAARGWIDRIRSTTVGTQARKNILREYLGADPKQPLFPQTITPAVMGAATPIRQVNEREQESP